MTSKERQYRARFPQIISTDIRFKKVQTQPDGTPCGIHVAAFTTDIALSKNPCKEKYSKNVELMRHHFVSIVASNTLLPFTRE